MLVLIFTKKTGTFVKGKGSFEYSFDYEVITGVLDDFIKLISFVIQFVAKTVLKIETGKMTSYLL